jgi:cyclophilin family peptidyl-prolyl cis-trans isomerase/protein-disulfide isomerase
MHFPSRTRAIRAVAVLAASTLMLTACGAVPANVPTPTAVQATPTSGAVMPTATAGAEATAESGKARQVEGDRPYATFSPQQRSNIALEPPSITIDVTRKYLATIKTAKGEMIVELDPSAAPNTVNNFIYLANNGFYDGLTFHRVEPGFVIQGGDPVGNGSGGPGYDVPPEINLKHVEGAIAMARTGGPAETTPNSGSQFYITLGAQPNLDGQYTSFGRTISGMEVAMQIAIGDTIERIDVVAEDGSDAKVAELMPTVVPVPTAIPAPTAVPVPATCDAVQTNIVAGDHVRGNEKAATTIIEYADLQCPSCAALNPNINTIYEAVSDTVRFVYRHYPLTEIHDKALIASRAAEAAHLQGKFQEFVDSLYSSQQKWATVPVEQFTDTVAGIAAEMGLNSNQLIADMQSEEVIARVNRDIASGKALQVAGTPTLFVDGQPLSTQSLADTAVITELRSYAAERQATAKSSSAREVLVAAPEQVTEKDSLYVLTVKTTKGDIELTIDTSRAPLNANAVVFLAQKGYYDNTPVQANADQVKAVIFGSSQFIGNPGFDCGTESTGSDFSQVGTVALNPVSQTRNTSALVLMYEANDQFNGQLTAIGRITAGLDIAKSLQGAQGETKADEIISITVKKQ